MKSELSFRIEKGSYSKIVEEIPFKLKRYVAKAGNSTNYLVIPDLQLSSEELNLLEQAKYEIIQSLSSSALTNESLFESARAIALRLISSKCSFDRAQILSLIPSYDTVGYGPLSILLEDKSNIEEIEINSPTGPISIFHSRYGRCNTNLRFTSEVSFRNTLNRFISDSEKELNDITPIIDVQINDSRVHAQLRPYASSGACATIRVNGRKESNIKTLTSSKTIDFDALAYLWIALENNFNIAISGAPASGKTTLLTCLLSLVPRSRRVIAVEEDVNELRFYSNVGSFVSLYGTKGKGFTTKDQVINALRMRPDMLVIGEMRGDEAKDVFSGANLGIPFITTMHSNEGGVSIVKRLLIRPMSVEPQAISALDISIQMSPSMLDKRFVNEISEYLWLSRAEMLGDGIKVGDDMVLINPIMFDGFMKSKSLLESKVVSRLAEKMHLTKEAASKELKKRAAFLKGACDSSASTLDLIEKLGRYGL